MAQADTCHLCGRPTPVPEVRRDGQVVCSTCYQREYVPIPCSQCGGQTRRAPQDDKPALCRRCRPRGAACIRCGKATSSHSMQTKEGPVCTYCRRYMEPEQPCANCGRPSRHLAANYKLGFTQPVCNRCQTAGHKTCSQCRKYRAVHSNDGAGRPLCAHCANETVAFRCPECGQPGRRHSSSQCHTCYYRSAALRRCDEMAQSLRHRWVRDAWKGFVAHLLAKAPPNGKLARVLERQARLFVVLDTLFPTPLSIRPEELVEALGRDGLRRVYLGYNYLTENGQLKGVSDDVLSRSGEEATRSRVMARVPSPWKRQLLERYQKHLELTEAAYRKKGWQGRHERFAPRTVTLSLRTAFKFLELLPVEVTALQGIDHFQLDRFVAQKPGHRNALYAFVRYLNSCESLFQRLNIESSLRNEGPPSRLFLPQKHSDALLQRWLSADGEELRNALIGLLMLVYARRAKQAVGLRRGDFTLGQDGTVTVRFGRLPVELDEAVASVCRRYLVQLERSRGTVLAVEDWAFPGRIHGRALTPDSVRYFLEQLGVTAEQLFSTAIVNFYRNGLTKPKVLVRILGISLPTALRYWQFFAPMVAEEVAYHAGRG